MKRNICLPGQYSWQHCAVAVAVALMAGLVTPALSTAAPAQEGAYTGCGGLDAPVVSEAFEARVVELVNQERASHGNLPPLKQVDALTQAARYHATDLGIDNYFNHDSHDRNGGGLTFVCGAFDRIQRWYTNWRRAAENIGAGYETPEEVVAAWMSGDGHRRNILNAEYTEVGVGYFQGAGAYDSYWVQDFGARQGVYPLVLNGDALTTDVRTLSVYLHGNWQEMRLRNDAGAWGPWQTFANRFTWTINPGAGEHYVYAEMRTSAMSSFASDTIRLHEAVTTPPIGNYRVFLPAVVTDPAAARTPEQDVETLRMISHLP